jgi:hypothetical protein
VDVTATLEASCEPEALYACVETLDRYPDWLDIVAAARPAEPADGDAGPAWFVDLRARLGPFARSKRLRMVRTVHEAPQRVRFERREVDGRAHSPWVLGAEVRPEGSGEGPASRLAMDLHYGGGLFGPVLERLLRDEIERSRPRLRACAEG